jgi:hypothetical protein
MGNCFSINHHNLLDFHDIEYCSKLCVENWNTLVIELFLLAGVHKSHINQPFIKDVYNFYHKHLPYHTHNHIYEVLQLGVCLLLHNKVTLSGITSLERSTFCIALLCHDIDHHGYTNNEIEDREQYLEENTYSDDDASSIASSHSSHNERHHISITQHLLKKHNISYDKALLIRLILFTDLAMHHKFIEMNTRYYHRNKLEKHTILILLMKLADIGHILRPWNIHLHNVIKINNERKQPLLMNDIPQDTIWFNNHYVLPLIYKVKEVNIGLYYKLHKLYHDNVNKWYIISQFINMTCINKNEYTSS